MKFENERLLRRLKDRNKKLTKQQELDLKFFDQMATLTEKAEEKKKSPKYSSGEFFDDSDQLKEIG